MTKPEQPASTDGGKIDEQEKLALSLMPREIVARAAVIDGARQNTGHQIRQSLPDVKIKAQVAIDLVGEFQKLLLKIRPASKPHDMGDEEKHQALLSKALDRLANHVLTSKFRHDPDLVPQSDIDAMDIARDLIAGSLRVAASQAAEESMSYHFMLHAKVHKHRAIIAEYARHKEDCEWDKHSSDGQTFDGPCTCGFSQAQDAMQGDG